MSQSIKPRVTNSIKASNKAEATNSLLLVDLIDHAAQHNCMIQASRLVAESARSVDPDAMVNFIKAFSDGVNHKPDTGFTMRRKRTFNVEGARKWIAEGGSYMDFSTRPTKAQKETFEAYLKRTQAAALSHDKVVDKGEKEVEADPRYARLKAELDAVMAKYQAVVDA